MGETVTAGRTAYRVLGLPVPVQAPGLTTNANQLPRTWLANWQCQHPSESVVCLLQKRTLGSSKGSFTAPAACIAQVT